MLIHTIEIGDSPNAPLAILVHGRAGNKDVMAPFKRCLPSGCTIICPQAAYSDPIGGFSWWAVTDHADISSEAESAADELSRFISEALLQYELTPSALIGCGFSQGGALLSVLLQRTPELFSKVAILASFVIKGQHTFSPFQNKSKVFIAHGLEDQVVSIDKARQGFAFLKEQGFTVNMVDDAVGHKVGSNGMRQLKEWMAH